MKKVLAVALAVLMLMMTAVPAFAFNVGTIEVGETISCNVTESELSFTFEAPYTGEFLVESKNDSLFDDYFDLYVYVVDSNGNVIGSDDDSGKNGAFKLPFVAYEGSHPSRPFRDFRGTRRRYIKKPLSYSFLYIILLEYAIITLQRNPAEHLSDFFKGFICFQKQARPKSSLPCR